MHFIDVAVPVPLRRTFTYRAETELQTGVRVRVPFGNRQLTGIVIGAAATPDDTSVNIKDIEEILDTSPVLAPVMVGLAQWLWQYYHHSPGEVLHTMLPVKIRKGEKAGPDEETYLVPSDMQAEKGSLERAPKQQSCLHDIQTRTETKRALTQRYSAAVISALKEKGLITESRHTPGPQPQRWLDTLAMAEKPVPDKEQAVAVAALTNTSGFSVSLLEGVTGSGKTEVYLQTIESILKNGRQVLILVPEIGLTPQTVARFQDRFNIDVGVLHSQLNDSQRLRVWQQAKEGELGLIIGTRSAIFTPLKLPGMLIVDEEHDESYKQQDGLRYHARDLAVMRAKQENIPLVLGTATPSLESLNNALAGRYAHLTLSQRAGGASATNMHLLDIRDQVVNAGLADGILPVMRRHLEQGNQVLVFINRRGFAPALLCHHCGYTMHCPRCDRPYTVHRAQNVLQCHHCGGTLAIPKQCEQCHSQDMVTAGVGTEQVEGALSQLFPDAPQVRIDSDAVRGKDKLQQTLNAINRRDYQLLIGTQILSKGHHFPHVTLVVVLDCDGALFSGDFRASEKLGQLVTQLAGRAGRASKPGEMWLQTHNPDHPLLLDLIHNGYAHFARHALTERKAALLPPHASQVVIRAEAGDARQAFQFLNQCKAELHRVATRNPPAQAGPLPGLIEKRQGRYRFMLVLTHAKRAPLHEAVRLALPGISALPDAARVRWSVDVDPTDFS